MRPCIRPFHSITCLIALLTLATPAFAGALPEFDASTITPAPEAAARQLRATSTDPAMTRLARVQSTDARYGVPSFVWGNRPVAAVGPATARLRPLRTADVAARAHLDAIAPLYRLQRGDIASAQLAHVSDMGSGPIIVTFRQQVDGIEVFRDESKVCMDRNLDMVSVSGYLPSRSAATVNAADAFQLSGGRAVALALKDFAGLPSEPVGVLLSGATEGGYEKFASPASMRERTDGLAVTDGLRARKVWFHLGAALEPAWYVEVMGETAAYSYVLSAQDGHLLFRHSIMQDAAFSYRVWSNTAAPYFPMDGPQGDGASPHPTGLPNLYGPSLIAPNLITLQNGPISSLDPWLAPGATETNGNNVDAYVDVLSPDGLTAGDFRATATSAGVFDRTYNHALSPGASADQRMASITSLFYINNFLHDMFYDSGLDEAAGNAQVNNYGRGGLGGDAILAEGQDYGGTNNANMSTPSDGASPRMQMYVFNPPSTASLVVNTPGGIAGVYPAGSATFGAQTFSLSGQVVAGQDAAAPIDDGCTAITSAVFGKIALIDRGICTFPVKAQNAQNAGAIGVIIVNNIASAAPPALTGSSATVTIPVISVTPADGALIRAQLAPGVTVTMSRTVQVQRDGTIDGHIVSHEWGHYVSNRLVGNASGLSNQQGGGMGEGWSDFFALMMTVRAGENLAGCYNVGPYALSSSSMTNNAYYFGIRRYPYTTDMTKNPLTFKHIANGQVLPVGPPMQGDPTGATNSEVHRTGEVWCAMLWECYAALLGDSPRLSFNEAQRRMKMYLIAGLKLTPNAPTLVEARDGILAAALANDAADFALLAQAFAKRGLGTGAIAPPRESTDNIGVIESYGVGADLTVLAATMTDDLHSCDNDTYLDNGERGTLTVSLLNSGATTLSATSVTVSSTHPGVTFPAGNIIPAAGTTPYTSTSVTIPVDLSGAAPGDAIEFNLSVDDPTLLVPGPRVIVLRDIAHVDEALFTSDAAETHHTAWGYGMAAGSAGEPWGRVETAAGAHAYHVDDAGGPADLTMTSPPLTISPSVPLVFTFQQRYSFEFDASANYDGGMIELSNNGGASWTDIGASATPTYNGTLYNASGNPLGGRSAWVKTSASYPALVSTTVNLGTTYAGQTVQVRYRHAADAGVGGPGWWIDNLAFTGLTTPPFLGIVGESGACTPLAVGDARPTHVALSMASGNPSRGFARLRFALPANQHVQLTVHDLAGRLVATLADGEFSAGWHDAAFTRDANGVTPGAGVYFARLRVDGRQFTQRVVLLR